MLNVGPATYEKLPTDLRKQPVYSMGAKLSTKAPSSVDAPSPFEYNVPCKMIESPGKTLSKKLAKPIQ